LRTLARAISSARNKSRSNAYFRRQVGAQEADKVCFIEAPQFGIVIRQAAKILRVHPQTLKGAFKQAIYIERLRRGHWRFPSGQQHCHNALAVEIVKRPTPPSPSS